jgi:hypothetical protein
MRILGIERGSTRWHCMKNSVWKKLWICCKTDYRMNNIGEDDDDDDDDALHPSSHHHY